MILHRVIQHFRKQEWAAIFLDFLIVVGVFGRTCMVEQMKYYGSSD